ncbi:MAG: helix-turn-helix transcriptional regulator [Candidatus Rokubacteria bacterium]|nr:helix-turn-helix transcriptional regulator [Candidatus Rokubacteria bacterium]
MAKSIRSILEEARRHDDYYEHWIVSDFTEELCRRMEARGLTRKSFAEAIGSSRAYVTKVLSGEENLTAKTMAKLARAVGSVVRVHLSPVGTYTVWLDVPGSLPQPAMTSNMSSAVNYGDSVLVAAGTAAGDAGDLRG